jgi:hypothetical protein|nr:MAG TPA: hypothetical protein [Caudoviricetes sp.]
MKAIESQTKNETPVSTVLYTDDGISTYETNESKPVFLAENDNLPYSDKYTRYTEYYDPNFSIIDENKNITLDPSQINLTQEENSQYVPFKMFRRYDNVDQLNMTLLMHCVTPIGGDVYVTPVNVQYDDTYLYFGVILPGSVCATKGDVLFEIQSIGTNEKGDNYKLITRNSKFNVEESLSGNGTVEPTPDTGWMTTFLKQVTDKVGEAQTAANEAKEAAQNAQNAADELQGTVDSAKEELTTTLDERIATYLLSYYTKTEIDEMFKNIDLTDVYDKINNIDGLAKFNVEYISDSRTITFYNGDTKIKDIVLNTDPSAEWVTAYGAIVDNKISTATTPIQESLDEFKESVNGDLDTIHQNIDDLPKTLKTKYYDKEATDELLEVKASISEVNNLSSKIGAVEQTANSNKSSIAAVGTKVADLEDLIGKISTDPGKTYDATYDDEYNYTLWEIENEGTEDEVRTAKATFKIVGGGGGGATTSTLKIEYVTKSPLIVTTNDRAIIKYNFSGQDSSGDIVSEGTYTWKIGKQTIATGIAINGENSFDATDYISLGTQKLLLSITDDAGSLVTKSWTVQKIDIHLDSSFNDKLTYPINEPVSFDYTPYGAISKDIHFKLDGTELYKVTTTSSGIPMAYNIQPQEHGAHLVEVYITAEVNGSTVESNHIYKDVIWYDSESEVPVIGCVSKELTVKQYDTENIVYTVYDPKTETPTVTLSVDDKEVSTLQLDTNTQTWQYKPTDVGSHVLTIKCRDVIKTINVTVEKLDIDVEPITAGLQFDFNPVGKSNNDANRLWICEDNSDIKMTVSDNFDWENGGYQIDKNGDQYFGIKAGTTATISYNLFADDARRNGKEFKFIFKTSNVAKADATFLACQEGNIGLQMNVHEAYIKSSAKSLYVPYSEDDVIEWEFNINKDSDIPIIMSYEDGTPCRPMSYTSDYSFTQENPVPITIGCNDCDVAIYRMKAYNTSLTTKAILSNFIADARTATEMIDRFKRNQIYDENQMLTPEHLSEACPDMRIIMIEAPHFTNNKKDFVKNTTVKCLYKNGDPTLDNWTFENAYHSGQGTTSNEYGASGRNIDVICCFDGKNQVTSKIPLDPDYKTILTLGDGTKTEDGTGRVSLTRDSVPNGWFNIKVNIASSEMVNNAYLQARYNTYLPYKSPAQKRDSRIKNDMEFVNCVVFIKESDPDVSTHREFQDTEWHYYALGNIGDSKKTDLTRAYDPDDMNEFCIEISDNTLANSTFQTGVTNSDGTMKYPILKEEWKSGNEAYDALYNDWDGTYEFRYDCCGDSKDGDPVSTDEAKTEIRKKNKQIWRDFYEFVITSSNKDFVDKLKDWFIVDSALYFYLFTLRYTMIDNRAKNVFPHWAKHYISNEEVSTLGDKAQYYTIDDEAAKINKGYRFDFWDYDNDSAIGINNSGELTMTYGKEDIDYRTDGDKSSGYIFNAADSVFFCRIRDLMQSQLRSMYNTCESKNCWSATSLINQFDEKQNEWCEELWRLDYERKYERTYRDGNTRFLEQMMNGKKKYQRRQFERDQEMYMATKFIGTTATSNQIMFRCNTPVEAVVKPDYTLHLTPYSDMYLSVMFGNSSPTQVRAKAGKQYNIKCPYTQMDDTAVLVYGASRIQSMGDVSTCYIHDNDFSKAEKLKELIVGNTTEGYSNTFLTNLVIGNNKLLEKLDVRNTPNLASSLDLSKCGNLKELYATGSGLTGVLFANGGKIQTALLPDTLTSINMRNLKYLNNLSIAGYDQITTMIIENCNTIDCADLLEKSPKVNRARIIGVDWELESTDLLEKLYKMGGVDKNGYNTDQSIVTGKVHVPVMREKILAQYNEAWSDLEITYNTLVEQFTVTFRNDNGDVLDVQYVDKGEKPIDPVTRVDNPIDTPKKASTISTDFTYKGWDTPLVAAFANQTYTATYTGSLRKYTVRYMSRGKVLETYTGEYGTYVEYKGDIPIYVAEEGAYKYYLFTGWDQSGLITGDKDINAVYDTCEYTLDYFKDKDLSTLRPVEIYAMIQLGLESNYVSLKDSVKLQFGHDYDYNDVEQKVLISEQTEFTGKNYVDTKMTLFDIDRDFVFATDYKFDSASPQSSVMFQCFEQNGVNGFKVWNNSGAKIAWGTSSNSIGSLGNREMTVIRHIKGETGIHVYNSNLSGDKSTYVELTKTRATSTSAPIVFGCSRADDGAYENYATGTVYWSKVWYADLGDTACKQLVAWTHESMDFEMCGFKRYYLSDNASKRTAMTFLAKNLLGQKKALGRSSNNSGGYAKCTLPDYLNTRVFEGLDVQWQQLLKKVKISSSIGDQSTEISYSDNYIYIPSTYELDPTMNTEPYVYEGSPITYLTTNDSRICKFVDGKANSYWTRSPNYQYTGYYYRVEENGMLSGYYYSYNDDGIRIMFSI